MFQRIPILRRADPRLLATAGLGLLLAAAPASEPIDHLYELPGAAVSTDLPPAAAREAALRLTALRPLLADPHWGWPPIPPRPPFLFRVELFRDATDFIAAGGPPNAAGVFLPEIASDHAPAAGHILAVAGPVLTLQTWHVLQHEAVHQYVYAACAGRSLPPWLEEGLAEYVGEALFTGDGYEPGIIPAWRLARLKQELLGGKLEALPLVFAQSRDQWSQHLSVPRYDQVWALVHFLKNADAGRFAPLLAACVQRGSADPLPGDVEADFRRYWLCQPPDPTADRYAEVVRATLAAFIDRAAATGRRFSSFADFATTAEAGRVHTSQDRWLPPRLLQDALDAAPACGTWRLIETAAGVYRLDVALPDGRVLRGQ